MGRTVLAVVLATTLGQAGSQPYSGTWVAEQAGTIYIRLELAVSNGTLGGKISLGNIEVDAEGVVRTAHAAPPELKPIFDVALRGPILSFSHKDGEDTDHFELRIVGDGAELRFLPSEEDRQELAANGIAAPKPIRLVRTAR